MTTTPPANVPAATPEQPTHPPDPLAGVLSYLVPGLGQIYQGRIGKGLVFATVLLGMFFYGLYLGDWQNVYMAQGERHDPLAPPGARRGINVFLSRILDRARIYGQIWIGVAAWPALYQYYTFNPNEKAHPVLGRFMREPSEPEQILVLQENDKKPDVGWMYTVIAGVLNIMVIYDAYAGPVLLKRPKSEKEGQPGPATSSSIPRAEVAAS